MFQEGTSNEGTPDSDISMDDVHKKGKEALQSPFYVESKELFLMLFTSTIT